MNMFAVMRFVMSKVLTRGILDEKVAQRLIADISRLAWGDALVKNLPALTAPTDRRPAG